MIVFVLGGVKSGKSMFAQYCAQYLHKEAGGRLKYIATMLPADDEDGLRIKRHVKDRQGWGFETVEEGSDAARIADAVGACDVVLMDSITSYVQNDVFDAHGIKNISSSALSEEIIKLLCRAMHTVVVSDYIFSNAESFGEGTLYYMKLLGAVHKSVATACDVVIECASSQMKIWKNAPNYDFSGIISAYERCDAHLYYKDI